MIDWLIRGALIFDGTGNPPAEGDIAIRGDRIVETGALRKIDADHLIRAEGRAVSPGFIDMHSHSDVLLLNGTFLSHKVLQGVTTELIGQDGMSLAPLTERSKDSLAEMLEPLAGRLNRGWQPWDVRHFLKDFEEKGLSVNVATLVGHCNLRLAAMGYRMGRPEAEELGRMKEILARSLEQGAAGLSLGLIYPPSSYSETDELVELARVVRDRNALLVAHMRNEQDQIFEAIEEMVTIGRKSGCRIHLSHLKSLGKRNWGRMGEVLKRLESARGEGVDLSFDQYPYTASCTSLSVLLPNWAAEGGWKGLLQRLEQGQSERILAGMREAIENRGGPESIRIASVKGPDPERFTGKTLARVAAEAGKTDERTALELLVENRLQVVAIYHSLSEPDVMEAMRHPLQTVGSDGITGGFPHPRAYGTFPRVLQRYSVDKKLFSTEEAIRKMTSSSAERLNLRGRGKIRPGYYADLLLFRPGAFQDHATFDHPDRLAAGLDWVFVNGVPVVDEGKVKTGFPGHVLRHGGV